MSKLDGNYERAHIEIERRNQQSVNKSSIKKLKSEEIASCLAVYLVNNGERRISSIIRLKTHSRMCCLRNISIALRLCTQVKDIEKHSSNLTC